MEKREAELLEKIKNSQSLQLREFNKLEEVMIEQQISVKKRLLQQQHYDSPGQAYTRKPVLATSNLGQVTPSFQHSPYSQTPALVDQGS